MQKIAVEMKQENRVAEDTETDMPFTQEADKEDDVLLTY